MEPKIPIVVGVTGHRDLRIQDLEQVRATVRHELSKLKNTYPNSPFALLNSLAEGADQMCAEIALELGYSLYVPLPFALDDYREDFSGSGLERFDALCASADEVFVVPPTEAPGQGRNYGYRQAGIYVCTHCHLLMALWDGSPAVPGGCGTAETVDFMLNTSYIPNEGSLISAVGEGAVLHIPVAREGRDYGNANGEEKPPRLDDRVPGSLSSALAATDRFNAEPSSSNSAPLISKPLLSALSPHQRQLHALYKKADARSLYCRDRYLSGMKWLSIMGVLLVLAFLLYGELNLLFTLPLYGLVLVFSYFLLTRAKRGLWHDGYLEYRALSETLRVQFYLGLCGTSSSLCDSFTWSQKMEVAWVKKALYSLLASPAREVPVTETILQEVKAQWIDHQLLYHQSKLRTTGRRLSKNRQIAFAMLLLSLLVYLGICAMELFSPQLLSSSFQLAVPDAVVLLDDMIRISGKNIAMITLGLMNSVTLFLSNYYGKLSLERRVSDHEKMAALYEAAQKQWNVSGSATAGGTANAPLERIAMELAREEIIENGIWLSYSRDNAPSVNL